MIFADTSALYAVIDRDDQNHARARILWEDLLDRSAPLLTHNYVLIEMGALLQRRIGIFAIREFEQYVVPILDVQWITARQHQTAVEMVLAANRRDLSLVDCASFVIMREHGSSQAFCFDRHFSERGIDIL